MPEVTFKNHFVGTIHGRKINAKPGDTEDVPARLVPLLVKFAKIDAPESDDAPEAEADTAAERETATDPAAAERETREANGDDDAPPAEPSAREIREWAKANDVEVPTRGGIPAEVRAAYVAAHTD